MDLLNPDWTIFSAVQHLIQNCDMSTKQEKMRRVWEPTYVIVYREAKPNDEISTTFSTQMSQLRAVSSSNSKVIQIHYFSSLLYGFFTNFFLT
jgi:E3 ubiquitin-protein ligase HECTD1